MMIYIFAGFGAFCAAAIVAVSVLLFLIWRGYWG